MLHPMKTYTRWLAAGAMAAWLTAKAPGAEEVKAQPNAEALAAAIDRTLVQERYDRGKELLRAGRQAEALNDFLWLYDVGMIAVPSFAGVRTSFLLSSIGQLAESYKPAREALLERCDEAEKRMLAEPNNRRAGMEFAALCGSLKDDARLMKAFDALPEGDARRRNFGLRAFRILLPQQRYKDALSAMPFESMKRLVDMRASRLSAAAGNARAAAVSLQLDIKSALDYIEVLAGAGELEQAKEMIGKLLEFDATPETERALAETLKRAGQPDLLKP